MAEDELWKTLLRFHQEVVKPDTFETLMRFHREVVKPEMEEMRDELRAEIRNGVTRDEFLSHMDSIYKRFERLETEYRALCMAVGRLEDRMAKVEQRVAAIEVKLDQFALRSEVEELEERVGNLNQRIADLKKQLN